MSASHDPDPRPTYRARRGPRLPDQPATPVPSAARWGWRHRHPGLFAALALLAVLLAWWVLRGG